MSTEDLDREVAKAADALAITISALRTHGSVYMDGTHNPRPSETIAARQFVYDLVAEGWTPPDRPW